MRKGIATAHRFSAGEFGTMDFTTTSLTLNNRTDNTVCPVARTARIISGKWTLLIIRDLASGVKRFNQLERSLQGISPKTLSERLRSLEEEGVILRQTFAEVPPRVEYTLTVKGRDLVEVVECMRCYGNQWLCDAPEE
jgi:DNA-binding HxlR family transcriptional regulator